jgi:hypothetical protein
MKTSNCPDIIDLLIELEAGQGSLVEHSKGCAHCRGLLDEHLALDAQLFRLTDPTPPPDLVAQVIARINSQPQLAQASVQQGLFILTLALAATTLSVVLGGDATAFFREAFSTLAVIKTVGLALQAAWVACWKLLATPMVTLAAALFLVSLIVLEKLARARRIESPP